MRRRLIRIGLGVLLALPAACRSTNPLEAGPGTIVDAVDDDGNSVTLRIDRTEPDPTDSELRLYSVSLRSASGWVPYCSPDMEGRSAAIPLAGSWHPVVGRVAGGKDVFTFACTSGAIGKCVRFGYKPWKTVQGRSLAPYHDACVRMVRADYCGNGRSHTATGVRIDLYDRIGIQKPDPDAASREEFEAAWGPGGVEYLRIPRLGEDVAAIVRECPERLAARTSLDFDLGVNEAMGRFPEALVFNNRMQRPVPRP